MTSSNFITRGTTPEITCHIGADWTGYTCYLSIGRYPDDAEITVTIDDEGIEYSEGQTTLTCTLTQEQTLALEEGHSWIQLRAIKDGDAPATLFAPVKILPVLQNEIIEEASDE